MDGSNQRHRKSTRCASPWTCGRRRAIPPTSRTLRLATWFRMHRTLTHSHTPHLTHSNTLHWHTHTLQHTPHSRTHTLQHSYCRAWPNVVWMHLCCMGCTHPRVSIIIIWLTDFTNSTHTKVYFCRVRHPKSKNSQVCPPFHCHKIAEPLMRQLVADDVPIP